MQKKSNFTCLKQHQLMWVLNECLAKILQILDVTLSNLVLQIDVAKTKRVNAECRESQTQTNNNTNHIYGSTKRLRMDVNANENEGLLCSDTYITYRLVLAHAIIDLLNTIEAGSKTTVIRTTEVCNFSF